MKTSFTKTSRIFFISIFSLFTASLLTAQDLDNPGWLSSKPLTPEEITAKFAAIDPNSSSSRGVEPRVQASALNAAAQTIQTPLPLELTASIVTPTPTAGGNEADTITPEIALLARGLNYDALKIYEYVYNYIEFEPYYGSKKGAQLTLLEKSGNDFDQSSLLVALLRASGLNPNYKSGACTFTYEDISSWMGLSLTPFSYLTTGTGSGSFTARFGVPDTVNNRRFFALFSFFDIAGYHYIDPFLTSSGSLQLSIPHVWVEVNVGGTVRTLSPSFKYHSEFSGLNLATATGYSKTQILADAAGTVSSSPDSATSLNYTNLSSRLSTYSQNLKTDLADNHPGLDVNFVAGSRDIIRYTFPSFAAVDSISGLFPWPECPWLSITPWAVIPDVEMSKIQIKCGTYNYTTKSFTSVSFDQTIKMPALKGGKLSLTWAGNTAVIRLNEGLLGSTFTIAGANVDIQLNATHNHYDKADVNGAYVNSNLGKSNQSETKPYLKGDAYAYAIVYAFDNPDQVLRNRQEILDGYRRSGLTESDWRVRTEILNIMGLQWFSQVSKSENVIGPLFSCLPFHHHRFGRVAQEQSYYIDVGLQYALNETQDSDS